MGRGAVGGTTTVRKQLVVHSGWCLVGYGLEVQRIRRFQYVSFSGVVYLATPQDSNQIWKLCRTPLYAFCFQMIHIRNNDSRGKHRAAGLFLFKIEEDMEYLQHKKTYLRRKGIVKFISPGVLWATPWNAPSFPAGVALLVYTATVPGRFVGNCMCF